MSEHALKPLLGAVASAGVFLAAWGLVHHFFWAHGQLVDTPTYQTYGDAIVHQGQVPYRDFKVEYPPGAVPVFVFPSLFGNYDAVFGWLMAVFGVCLVAVVATIRRSASAYVAIAPVLVGSLILSRFDLWPALLATAALAALIRDRHALGWGLLGAAVAAKLWPFVLVPPALVFSHRRGRLRASVAGIAVAAVAFLPFAILAPGGLWSSLHGQASRPLQIESLAASFLTVFAHPLVVSGHGSQNIARHGTLAALLGVVQAISIVALWIAFARGPASPERLLRYAAAAVCAFVAFGKVLSPQYLVWLVPLVPLVRGLRGVTATALLTAALILTQVWFPWRYFSYATDFHLAWVVLTRDLVLVALLAVLALPLRSPSAR